LVAMTTSFRFAKSFKARPTLTLPKGIDVGGIEEIDPQLEGFLDDRPAVFLVEHPLVDPRSASPNPYNQGRFEIRPFQCFLASCIPLLFPSSDL
jgi:hypothetical protein